MSFCALTKRKHSALSTGFFALVHLSLLVGCHPPAQGSSQATSKAGADDSGALPERPPSSSFESSDPPHTERKVPRPCAERKGDCASYLSVIAHMERGDSENALLALDRISTAENGEEKGLRLLLRGWALLESDSLAYGAGGENSQQAAAILQSALPYARDQDFVRLQIARARLALGQGAEALPEFGNLATRYGGDAEVQAGLGIAYLATGRTSHAISPLKRAAQLDPNEPERLIVLGAAHLLLGDLSEAERRFRGAIALDGNSTRAHGDLGALLLLQGNLAEGKAHLLRAFQLSPESATYAANLAYAEFLADQPAEAEKWAKTALELDPELASAWLNLGLVQAKKGAFADARASFERAREIDPTDPRPDNNLRDLDEMEEKK